MLGLAAKPCSAARSGGAVGRPGQQSTRPALGVTAAAPRLPWSAQPRRSPVLLPKLPSSLARPDGLRLAGAAAGGSRWRRAPLHVQGMASSAAGPHSGSSRSAKALLIKVCRAAAGFGHPAATGACGTPPMRVGLPSRAITRRSHASVCPAAAVQAGKAVRRAAARLRSWGDSPGVRVAAQVVQFVLAIAFVALYVASTYSPPAPDSPRYALDLWLCAIFALEYVHRMLVGGERRTARIPLPAVCLLACLVAWHGGPQTEHTGHRTACGSPAAPPES
jgi:hypothetical protein